MNKGVIVQLEVQNAIIMKNDGAFISCPRNSLWQLGDVVTISHRRRISLKAVLGACAVLLLVFFGAGAVLYNIPTTYMEISVNPSVQLTLNRFDRVLGVTALNPDGDSLLQGISFKNLTLYEAYSRLFNRLENNGYLRNATVQLVVANNSQITVDKIEQVLRDASEKYTGANDMQISIMRYTGDEYLSLTHPLPLIEIPDISAQDATEDVPSEETPSEETPSNGSPLSKSQHCGRWRNGWWDWDSEE